VLRAAGAAGLSGIVLPGEDVTTSQRAAYLAEHYAGVSAAAGFHPHKASLATAESLGKIERLLEQPHVVAVGEIGLDFLRNHSPVEAQIGAFGAQLEIAAAHTMPVIVHCREAWQALDGSLMPWAQRVGASYAGRPPGVLHYFSSDVETAKRYVDLGFLISIHTSVTHKKSAQLREVAAALPLEALVIETDSPYGAPQAYRGKRNEPAFVIEAAKAIAEARGETLETIAAATTANARRLFRLDSPAEAAPRARTMPRRTEGAVS
jgi:TatD DNase family protein